MRTIIAAEEVDADITKAVEDMAEGWVGRVEQGGWGEMDWDDFLYRLEADLDIDLGTSMESPAIKKIQKIARAVIRESLT